MTLKGLFTVGAAVALLAGCADKNKQAQMHEEEPFTPSSNYDSLDSMDTAPASYAAQSNYAAPANQSASTSYDARTNYAAPANHSTPHQTMRQVAASNDAPVARTSSGSSSGGYARSTNDEVLAPTGEQTYVVRKGDTLYSLARRFYGKDSAWRTIYNANRDRLSNPNRLNVGAKLVIPYAAP